jgi:hypothetical protein
MFGPRGNPQPRNLFGISGYLQNRPASSSTSGKDQGDRLEQKSDDALFSH